MSVCEESSGEGSDSFASYTPDELNDAELMLLSPRDASSDAERTLLAKNSEIVTNLLQTETKHAGAARKLSQKEELAKAEAMSQNQEPSWLLRARKKRSDILIKVEEKREKSRSQTLTPLPAWVQKAKDAQISRDLRGLDRYIDKKAPALPPAPEWAAVASKKRDLSSVAPGKVYESNKTALWFQNSNAQKILNAFLQEDQALIPDWMDQGISMSDKEKSGLMAQLEQLKELLEEERKLTAERQSALDASNYDIQVAEKKLDESVVVYRNLRENRKNKEKAQGCIAEANEVFKNNAEEMTLMKNKYGLDKSVRVLTERQATQEIKRKKSKKTKRSKKKSDKDASLESSNDATPKVKKKKRKSTVNEKKI